jgi:hypothetical protein
LPGEFWLTNTREAQAAADGIVAPSIGVHYMRDRSHPDPDEWHPYPGVLDWCWHMWANVEEVSLTPTPQFPTTINHVW